MSRQPKNQAEVAQLCVELRQQGRTYREIAERVGRELRVNARVAFRMAHGWTQGQVAERWNTQWPDADAPKTSKQISYWETWPAPSGRRPSVETLNKLALLYQCDARDLHDGEDYSHLDPATSTSDGPPEQSDEPSPNADAMVGPPEAETSTIPTTVARPDPAATGGHLLVPEPSVIASGGRAGVVGGILGLSANQRDILIDLIATWVPHMDRRIVLQALGWGTATTAVAPMLAGSLNPDEQARLAAALQKPRRVDATVIGHLEQVLTHCHRQDDTVGPQAVLDIVLAQRELAASMLAECPAELRPRLLSLYADQSRLAGWLYYNLNDFASAAFYYEQARSTAHEARNTALAARVLCQMSQLGIWQGRPRVGLDHAVAAQNWARRTDDQMLRAVIAATTARAYAREGQEKACLTQLDTAHTIITTNTGQPTCLPLYTEGLHMSIHGECLLQLHRPTDAIQVTEASLATLDPRYVRVTALTVVDLGRARLACREVDHAAAALEQAADLAVQNHSPRLTGEITAARARMQPWQNSPAVIQLDQRLQAYQLV
ncbi:MAG: helix-turn-helix transcriptional regulator [Pseudonocardia sp.]